MGVASSEYQVRLLLSQKPIADIISHWVTDRDNDVALCLLLSSPRQTLALKDRKDVSRS